jgi:hypothetical protein
VSRLRSEEQINWRLKASNRLGCVCVISLAFPLVPTKLLSGTIILLGFVGNRIIVGADSRETLKETSSFDDDACKIIPLGDQMFFAGTGILSRGVNIGDNFAVGFAHVAYEQFRAAPKTEDRNKNIADRWVN